MNDDTCSAERTPGALTKDEFRIVNLKRRIKFLYFTSVLFYFSYLYQRILNGLKADDLGLFVSDLFPQANVSEEVRV